MWTHGVRHRPLSCPSTRAASSLEVPDYEGMQTRFELPWPPARAGWPDCAPRLEIRAVLVREKSCALLPALLAPPQALMYKRRVLWFVRVTQIRDRMVEPQPRDHLDPAHIKDGTGKVAEGACDWSISGRTAFWRCAPTSCGCQTIWLYLRTDVYVYRGA